MPETDTSNFLHTIIFVVKTLNRSRISTKVKNLYWQQIQKLYLFYRDFFSVQLSPHKLEFGHVCEDPHNWEQRYERKDFKNHRDMGKVTIPFALSPSCANFSYFFLCLACLAWLKVYACAHARGL